MFERPRWLKAAPNSPWAFLGVNVWTLKKTSRWLCREFNHQYQESPIHCNFMTENCLSKKNIIKTEVRSSKSVKNSMKFNNDKLFKRNIPAGEPTYPSYTYKNTIFSTTRLFSFYRGLKSYSSNAFKYHRIPISACISYEARQRKTKQTKTDKTNHHTLVYLENYVYI